MQDEAYITVKAGDGGPGKVSFFPGKKSGPDGGDGGRGGDVYFRANKELVSLTKYVSKTFYKAQNGENGRSNRQRGKDGDNLYLDVPIGTKVTDEESGNMFELLYDGQEECVCIGGNGGRGNDFFKSPRYTTPKKAQPGIPGQEKRIKLVMRLIADIGLVGLPSAGKSSLLNALTAAEVKTAEYHFTTLRPNLAVTDGTILADIPGLIEGASQGKGLGIRFLKHIEKVKILFHCISVESTDLVRDYHIIREELALFNPQLVQKKEHILLTKVDLISEKEWDQKVALLKSKLNLPVIPISIVDDGMLTEVKRTIIEEA